MNKSGGDKDTGSEMSGVKEKVGRDAELGKTFRDDWKGAGKSTLCQHNENGSDVQFQIVFVCCQVSTAANERCASHQRIVKLRWILIVCWVPGRLRVPRGHIHLGDLFAEAYLMKEREKGNKGGSGGGYVG